MTNCELKQLLDVEDMQKMTSERDVFDTVCSTSHPPFPHVCSINKTVHDNS